MFERETILPLTFGAVFAVLLHVAAAGALVQLQTLTPPDPDPERDPAEQPSGVDLAAEAIEVTEPRVAGEPAVITYRIRNRGDAVAGETSGGEVGFGYSLTVEGEPLHGGRIGKPLQPGETIEREIAYTADRAGTHRLTLEVDPQREIDDADRASNRLSEVFFWDPAEADRPDGIDVAVAELRVGRPRIVGAPVTVSGRIVNLGRSDAGVFNLVLRIDGEAVAERTLDGLPGGESERFVERIYVDQPGEREVTLVADPAASLADLNRDNNALTRLAEWKAPEDLDTPPVGQSEPSPVTLNWISYEDYEDLVARQAEFEQAAVQPDVDPVENAPTPQDPTPPAPPQMDEQTTPPPAPDPSMQPQPTPRVAEPEPTPEQPSQPTVPEQITEQDMTAPALDLEADMAAAAAEADAALPDPPDLAELEATRTEPVTVMTETEDPLAAVPEEAAAAREIAIATPDMELAGEEADILLPEPTEQPPEPVADRRTPVAEVDPDGDPADRSLQLRVEELLDRREVTLPLKPDAEADPGSPQQDETATEPEDRETQTADRPVDESQPLRDGAMEQPQQEQPESPTQQEPAEAQQSDEADPTAAPRDERESPPVSRLTDVRVQPGRVIARQGIEVRTVEPRFSNIARRTALPRNPDVVLTFNKQGEVVHAQIVRSTGYANVDGPVLASLYRWSATGELLEQVDDTFTMRVRILFGVEDEDDD